MVAKVEDEFDHKIAKVKAWIEERIEAKVMEEFVKEVEFKIEEVEKEFKDELDEKSA